LGGERKTAMGPAKKLQPRREGNQGSIARTTTKHKKKGGEESRREKVPNSRFFPDRFGQREQEKSKN